MESSYSHAVEYDLRRGNVHRRTEGLTGELRRYDSLFAHMISRFLCRHSRTGKGITIFFMHRDSLRIGSRLDLETMSSGNMIKYLCPTNLCRSLEIQMSLSKFT